MFDAVDLDAVTEHGVDDVVQLVRVVYPGVQGELLALGALGLHVVLPEESLLPAGAGAAQAGQVLLVYPQVVLGVALALLGQILVLAVDIVQLAGAETVEHVGHLVSDAAVPGDAADGVHVGPGLPPVPDHVQGLVLDGGALGELRYEERVGEREGVPLSVDDRSLGGFELIGV